MRIARFFSSPSPVALLINEKPKETSMYGRDISIEKKKKGMKIRYNNT